MSNRSEATFAKLLAQENIIVVYSSTARTASFNTDNRVLTFPRFDVNTPSSRKNMLAVHEVGHALYSPSINAINVQRMKRYRFDTLNVVEDARIENMMRKNFNGAGLIFYDGYKNAWKENWFGSCVELKQKFVTDTMNPIDVLNINCKVGANLTGFIVTDPDLLAIQNRMINLYDYELVDQLCVDVEIYVKKWLARKPKPVQQPEAPKAPNPVKRMQAEAPEPPPVEEQKEEEESTPEAEFPVEEKPEEVSAPEPEEDDSHRNDIVPPDEQPKTEKEAPEESDEGESDGEEEEDEKEVAKPEVAPEKDVKASSQQNFDDNLQDDFVSPVDANAQAKSVVFNSKFYYDRWIQHFVSCSNLSKFYQDRRADDTIALNMVSTKGTTPVLNRWMEFDNQTTLEATIIAGRFQQMITGMNYSEAQYQETGDLDFMRLNEYLTAENIFMDQVVLPNILNHGIVFLLDCSGSMVNGSSSTSTSKFAKAFRQVVIMAKFCNQVNVPFSVIGVGANIGNRVMNKDQLFMQDDPKEIGRHENFVVPERGNVFVELLSSDLGEVNLGHVVRGEWMDHFADTHRSYKTNPGFTLGGTPLLANMLAMPEFLNEFKQAHKIEEIALMILTDGADTNAVRHLSAESTGHSLGNIDGWGPYRLTPEYFAKTTNIVDATYAHQFYLCTEHVCATIKRHVPGVKLFGYYIQDGYSYRNQLTGQWPLMTNTNVPRPVWSSAFGRKELFVVINPENSAFDMVAVIPSKDKTFYDLDSSPKTKNETSQLDRAQIKFEELMANRNSSRIFADHFSNLFA